MSTSNDPMNDVDRNASVTEQASHWWVVLNCGPTTPADHKAFGDWVARSPERIEAFLQTALVTKALKSEQLRWPDTPVAQLAREVREAGDVVRLRDLNSRSSPETATETAGTPNTRRSHRLASMLAVAASVAGLVAGGLILLDQGRRYETGIGEQRSVVLDDGSLVTLNTASRIEVKLGKKHRLVRLVSGEALFQVARDAARPFDVVTGNTTVRAVGTQFNVDKRTTATTVTVVEGKIAVSSSSFELPSTWNSSSHMAPAAGADETVRPVSPHSSALPLSVSSGPAAKSQARSSHRSATHEDGKPVTFLEAGQQLVIALAEEGASVPHAADVAKAVAWTQRRLVFERRSLGDVAAEFNRYNAREIRIEGEGLRSQEVTGVFQANDPESFLDFVAKIPGTRIERSSDRTIVFDAP
jgi:transmembrane sensor